MRHPMWWFSRPEFHISRLKIYHEKTQMGGKVRKNAQFILVDKEEFDVFFTAQCLAYFETQPSGEVFEEFRGIFCTLYSRK